MAGGENVALLAAMGLRRALPGPSCGGQGAAERHPSCQGCSPAQSPCRGTMAGGDTAPGNGVGEVTPPVGVRAAEPHKPQVLLQVAHDNLSIRAATPPHHLGAGKPRPSAEGGDSREEQGGQPWPDGHCSGCLCGRHRLCLARRHRLPRDPDLTWTRGTRFVVLKLSCEMFLLTVSERLLPMLGG